MLLIILRFIYIIKKKEKKSVFIGGHFLPINETSKIWFSIIALAENHVRNFYERSNSEQKPIFYPRDMM